MGFSQNFGIKNNSDINYSNSIQTNAINGVPFQVDFNYDFIEPEANNPCKSNLIFEINYSQNIVLNNSAIQSIINAGYSVLSHDLGIIKFKKRNEADGFSTAGSGSLSFTPIVLNCENVNADLTYKLYYQCLDGAINDQFNELSALQTIQITNSNTQPNIIITKITENTECSGQRVMYKLTSFGRSDIENYIKIEFPSGIEINHVYNTSGNEVPFNYDGQLLDFLREEDPLKIYQEFYVDVYYPSLTCETNYTIISKLFTYDFCDTNNQNQISVQTPYNFVTCSCGDPSIGDNQVMINGNLFFSKTLQKVPFRYVGFPDNCKDHIYELNFSNFSNETINNFSIADDIANIISNTDEELKITKIEINYSSLNQISNNSNSIDFSISDCFNIATSSINQNQTIEFSDQDYSFADCYDGNLAQWLTFNFSNLNPLEVISIKIHHRLMHLGNNQTLRNEAKVVLAGNHYTVKLFSSPDVYKPIVSVVKKVRNLTQNQVGYSSSTSAVANDQLEFFITVKNYGLAAANNFNLTDILEQNGTNFTIDQNSFEYTNALDQAVEFNTNGFLFKNNTILPAATCENGYEVQLKYKVIVNNNLLCNTQTTNKVVINYDNLLQPINSNINYITVDNFRGIDYKYTVTNCNGQEVTATNVTPGDQLNFKVSIRNLNNTSRNIGFQLALPLVNQSLSYGNLNIQSTSGVGNINVIQDNFSVTQNILTPNFLNSNVNQSTQSGHALEWKGDIPANTIYTLTFNGYVPTSTPLSSIIKSDFGISVNPNNTCAIVRKRTILISVNQNNCNTPTQLCQDINYSISVEKISPIIHRVTLKFLETNTDIQTVKLSWNDIISNGDNYLLYAQLGQGIVNYGNSFQDVEISNKSILCFTGHIVENDEIVFDLYIKHQIDSEPSYTNTTIPMEISFNGSNFCFACEFENLVSIQNGLNSSNYSLNDIKIYPNPTQNIININADDVEQVKMYNLLGQELFPQIEKINSSELRLDISQYSNGIYIINVFNKHGENSYKIIKE
jgi:uncharacterized repeat protein (TIGR01451 family)